MKRTRSNHIWVLIYLLLELCMSIAFGQLSGIRFVDNQTSYSGKIELQYQACDFQRGDVRSSAERESSLEPDLGPVEGPVCSSKYYAVCHNSDSDLPSWNRAAATTACKQLGFEAGWPTSEPGLTTTESIEDITCNGQPSSLENCTFDRPETCGCGNVSLISSTDRCNEHVTKEQAAVQCFNFSDINLSLERQDGILQIEYRQEQNNVCFNGETNRYSPDWSIREANVACRQMGFPQGATSTNSSFVTNHANEYLTRSSFAEFSCNGDEDNLFSCLISEPPRNKSCSDGLIVLLECNLGKEDGTETSSISTKSTMRTLNTMNRPVGKKKKEKKKEKRSGSSAGVSIGALVLTGILSVVFFIIIVIIVVVVVVVVKSIRKRPAENDVPIKVEEDTLYENQAFSADLDVDPYEDVDFAEYEDVMSSKWDIAFENLKLTGDILGKGNFGEVQLANVKIKDKWMVAAVKTLKQGTPETERMLFKEEFQTMTKIGYHPNVVNILGSCEHEGSFYVILEYVHHGNLRKFLRTCRNEDKEAKLEGRNSMALNPDQLLNFAIGVAKAMQHIAACGVIHRDLAARNVLIGRGYTPKVADFGLSREDDIYVQTSSRRVPARWLAIESMTKKTYSTKSDVWSFGILLWEIATFGGTPYPDMETKELAYQLTSGYRMPKPESCQDEMYQLMLKCWHVDPDSRPSFEYIVDVLTDMASQDKIYMETPYTNASVLQFRYPAVRPEKDDK